MTTKNCSIIIYYAYGCDYDFCDIVYSKSVILSSFYYQYAHYHIITCWWKVSWSQFEARISWHLLCSYSHYFLLHELFYHFSDDYYIYHFLNYYLLQLSIVHHDDLFYKLEHWAIHEQYLDVDFLHWSHIYINYQQIWIGCWFMISFYDDYLIDFHFLFVYD